MKRLQTLKGIVLLTFFAVTSVSTISILMSKRSFGTVNAMCNESM